MKNREAYSLRNILIVYNVALVILSLYMFYEVSIFRNGLVITICLFLDFLI